MRMLRGLVLAGVAAVLLTGTAPAADKTKDLIVGKWEGTHKIKVNDELEQLDAFLTELPDLLMPGGRAAIISFHSLEDRRVKVAFRDDPDLTVLTKKPLTASAEETQSNPRARSARLVAGPTDVRCHWRPRAPRRRDVVKRRGRRGEAGANPHLSIRNTYLRTRTGRARRDSNPRHLVP